MLFMEEKTALLTIMQKIQAFKSDRWLPIYICYGSFVNSVSDFIFTYLHNVPRLVSYLLCDNTYDLSCKVLPEKRTGVGAAMMGSAHTYDVGGGKKMTAEGIEVS